MVEASNLGTVIPDDRVSVIGREPFKLFSDELLVKGSVGPSDDIVRSCEAVAH